MGMVFTYRQVSEGGIPKIPDFSEALLMTEEAIRTSPAICAAAFIGSVPRGDYSHRSDLDVFVVFKDEIGHEGEAMEFLRSLVRRGWERYCVPVNIIPTDVALVGTSMHSIGPGFMKHVLRSLGMRSAIKGEPLSFFAPSVSVIEETRNYLRAKVYTLTEGWVEYGRLPEEGRVRFLKKAFEAPIHIMRRVLDCNRALSLEDDTKHAVRAQYETMCVDKNLTKEVGEIFRADERYSAFIHDCLTPSYQVVSFNAYENEIRALEAQVPLIIHFARENARMLAYGGYTQTQIYR